MEPHNRSSSAGLSRGPRLGAHRASVASSDGASLSGVAGTSPAMTSGICGSIRAKHALKHSARLEPSVVIAGLDPAIHHLRKKMDARVKPAHDAERAVQAIDVRASGRPQPTGCRGPRAKSPARAISPRRRRARIVRRSADRRPWRSCRGRGYRVSDRRAALAAW